MATAKELLAGSTGTAFTITLASLAASTAREATAISNTTNLYLDALISGKITTGAATSVADCYILGAAYDGTNYPFAFTAALTGSDANVTLGRAFTSLGSLQYGQPVPGTGLVFLCAVPTGGVATAVAVTFGPVGLSQAFNMGGLGLPPSFSVVVVNGQGQAFDSTAGHFAIYYNGIQQTIA